ncbi:MAG: tRNA-(ms[2]io[6]A)-hydroxylase [Pseudomonadota bacterium]|jgi:tRNA-(ms[2]io[6]A)-hydroxylase|nr:MAG: tRNA-(ms[2]io[6]A)-hydroxylase [Pseudomonadota bacterium]
MLKAATPESWARHAAREWRTLLVDHANCEKKAASTALALMFAYPEDRALSMAMARLAREELRHFEQVQRIMQQLGVPMTRLAPGRYAGELRRHLAVNEPRRKFDLLLSGALIEARSCERFEVLAPLLDEPLAEFYAALAASERRHAGLYLELARAALPPGGTEETLAARLDELAQVEARLVLEPDAQFRFHSGVPSSAVDGESGVPAAGAAAAMEPVSP